MSGARPLRECDDAVERWLRGEVAEAYDEMRRAPERFLAAEVVGRALRQHHAKRLKAERTAKGRGAPTRQPAPNE